MVNEVWRAMNKGERLPKHASKKLNYMTALYECYYLLDDTGEQIIAMYKQPRIKGFNRFITV